MLQEKNINDYLKEYPITWVCTMPEGCPPLTIMVPNDHRFYRYAKQADTYNEDDFKSYAELNPNKDWGTMLPLAIGLSLIDNEQKAKNNLKLPMLKTFSGVIELNLNPTDGVVKQTGSHKSHYTWWRTTSFNLSNLKMLDYDKTDNQTNT